MPRVNVATSLGRSGLQDWLLQRISAVILGLYLIFWLWYFISTPSVSHADWKTLFSSEWLRFSTLIVLLSLVIHAWVGIWTVATDYIKMVWLRLILLCVFGLGLLFCLLWGFKILWSV